MNYMDNVKCCSWFFTAVGIPVRYSDKM